MPRFIAATVVLLAAATSLVGCVKEEEPEPQWTEESAYAAAEETFRAYWAAGAIGGEKSEEKQYVTGDLLEHYEEQEADAEAKSIEARGTSEIGDFVHDEFRTVGETAVVEARVCIDDSNFEIKIDDGDWYSPRQDPIYTVTMRFTSVDDRMLLASLDESGDDEC